MAQAKTQYQYAWFQSSFKTSIVNVHNFQNQRDIRMAEVAESLPPGDFRWFQSSDKKWQRNPHPNKLFAVELSQLFVEQLHISVEFQVRAKLKWSKMMLTFYQCQEEQKNENGKKKIISVFTNIEEYQLLQIGKDLVVEGTHIEQVIEVLVGALD